MEEKRKAILIELEVEKFASAKLRNSFINLLSSNNLL